MISNKRGKGKRPSGILHLQSRSLDGIGKCWSASLEHRRRSESFLATHSTLPLQAKPEAQNDLGCILCQFPTFSRSLGWTRSFSLVWRDSIFWAQVDPFVVEPHPEHFQSAEGFLDFFKNAGEIRQRQSLVSHSIISALGCWLHLRRVTTLGQWTRLLQMPQRDKICKPDLRTQFQALFRPNTCFFSNF